MTAPNRWRCRAIDSARVWRRLRMAERRAARAMAGTPPRSAVRDRRATGEPIALGRYAPTPLAATLHGLVAPEASLEGRPGRWIV